VYRITLRQRSVVTLNMKSQAFDSYLVLIDTAFHIVFEDDDAGPNTRDARIIGSLEPGAYYLLATTVRITTGPYTASAAVDALRSCAPKDLGIADSASGRLTRESCRVLDVLVPSDDDTFLDLYRMTVDKLGVLTLDMRSRDFSPYLAIVDQQN